MNSILSLIHGVVIILTTITSPAVSIIKPASYINPVSTRSAQVKLVSPSTSTPIVKQTQKVNNKPESATLDIVRAQNSINYMNQETTYYINIPRNGGRISGKVSGQCDGIITGEFNGQTVDYAKTSERQDITGKIICTCKAGPIPVPASARFYGEVSFVSGRVSLTVEVEKPFQGRYYLSLNTQ